MGRDGERWGDRVRLRAYVNVRFDEGMRFCVSSFRYLGSRAAAAPRSWPSSTLARLQEGSEKGPGRFLEGCTSSGAGRGGRLQ